MAPLKEGTYFGKLIEIGTDRLGNQARTMYVYVRWDVTHYAVDGQWAPIEPARRECRWWVTEKAEPYTMDRLMRLGFNGEFDDPQFDLPPENESRSCVRIWPSFLDERSVSGCLLSATHRSRSSAS